VFCVCTVVLVPLGGGGFLLGHNRDERRSRARATPPRADLASGLRFVAPGDPDGGGTWIGVNDAGVVACLLNAAEVPGRAVPVDPPSRGLLVREAMECRSFDLACERFSGREADWRRRRAFHLVIAARGKPGASLAIARLAWDGAAARWDRLEGPAFLTSSTFDGTGVDRARREAWVRFLDRARDPARELPAWLASHDPARGPYSVCMHREEARTVSRTLVTVRASGIALDYLDGPPCAPEGPRAVVAI
jgi:hypothetical protein